MSHRNYSMFSKKVENNESVVEEKQESTTVTVEPVQTMEPEQNKIIGIVDGCECLNIRSKPNKGSDVLCVVDKATSLNVDINNSTEDFYKIVTPVGIEGYCMKQFVIIQYVNE